MKVNFAVCDDNSIDSEYVTELVRKWSNDNKYQVNIDTFSSSEAFFFIISKIKNMMFYC